MLFFDPVVSGPKDVACSTCHLPRFAFGDTRQFPVGAGASGLGPARTDPEPSPLRPMPRNSPTVLNVGLFGRMGPEPTVNGTIFWGGSAFGIEDQVLAPLADVYDRAPDRLITSPPRTSTRSSGRRTVCRAG